MAKERAERSAPGGRRGHRPPRPDRKTEALHLRIRFRGLIAMGPGKADLLRRIERTGSISAAAREMKMSYRRAWVLVDIMNRAFRNRVVETSTGGRRGGGARVTRFGREALRRYLAMESKAAASVRADLAAFRRLLVPARRS